MRIRFARFITGSPSLVRFTLCVNLRTVTVLRPVVFSPLQQKKPPFRWLLLVGTTGPLEYAVSFSSFPLCVSALLALSQVLSPSSDLRFA